MLRRWPLTASAAVLLLVAASIILIRIGSRREAAMQAAADAATAAVQTARAADAAAWAPDELLTAEGALRTALSAQRVEADRLWPIPDSSRVVAACAEAERAGHQAEALAHDRRATAMSAAASAIENAAEAVSASANLASIIHFEALDRSLLSKAQSTLTEARVYAREGDLNEATRRAHEAMELAERLRDRGAAVAARYADAETVVPWRRWIEQTIAWSRREARAAIVIVKEAHQLTLYLRGEPVKRYKADLGFNWIANKSRAGDDATPEGRYRIVSRVSNSAFHKALLIDYPNKEDRTQFNRARRSGDLPASAGIGGLIEIHGEGGRGRDWTEGCIALTNADIDDLFARVGVDTPVTIVGSDDFGAIAEFAAQYRDGTGRQR
jgi:lipoprotein-anchoring transpeptidase ErfK/SrfK